jgi:toxin FitB
MAAMRRRAGRSVEIRDALIAGIVSARKATLATGNRRHFEGFEIRLVDPWSS